jgi:hypothetical protein
VGGESENSSLEGRIMADQHLEELSKQIRARIESYEGRMAAAMVEGNEGQVRTVHDEFQETMAKDLVDFAEMAGEPLKSTLLALISLPVEGERR